MATAPARPTADDRIRAATWFADRGFGVFSVWSTDAKGVCRCPKGAACDNAGKHPIGFHGFKDATDDPERIRVLLSAASEPNYGLVCPEGVFALDVDGDGVAHLAELEEQMGALPPTLRTRTSGGEHVFLRWPDDHPRPIGQLFGYVTRWGSGTDAGYVIGPRSVHATGRVYEPVPGSLDIATLPEAWATTAVTRPEADDGIAITIGGYQVPDYGYTGSRYKAILSYVASRYGRGISIDEIWAGVVSVLAPRFEQPLAEPDLRSRFERAWKGTPARLGEPIHDIDPLDLPPLQPVAPVAWPESPADAAYHGVLGDIVRAVAPVTEADPVAILGSLLAAAGACMGHFRTIYQGSTQATNLFVALVGDSSTGRKGTAASIARDVMSAAYPDWERLIVAGLGSGEGLIGHLKNVEATEHRALVLESEFGRLLTVMAREGSTLSPVVRDAWDGAPMGRFLAREQSLVILHHVAIAAHVTGVELRQKLTDVDAANGFGNRFMWLAVRRTRLVPFPESPRELVLPYTDALFRAIDQATESPAELKWSPLAADRWETLYAASAAHQRPGLLGSLLARSEAQITRLALLYALLDRSSEVGAQHLAAAEALWAYAERSVVHIFGSTSGNRHADALLEYLREGPVDWESAKKALGLRTAADLQEAVDVLLQLGQVEVTKLARDGGGRSRRIIRNREETMQTMQTTIGHAQ
jgi:hypothetical protein